VLSHVPIEGGRGAKKKRRIANGVEGVIGLMRKTSANVTKFPQYWCFAGLRRSSGNLSLRPKRLTKRGKKEKEERNVK